MKALVTGAASGIGAAVRARLLTEGWQVVGLDRVPGPSGADWLVCDLADPVAIRDLTVPQGLTGLVNAAGLPPRPGQSEQILRVNIAGLRALTERALPAMGTGGAIVTVASKAGARWRGHLDQIRRLLDCPEAELGAFAAAEGLDPVRAYDLSKEAAIVWTKAQTARLRGMGVRANTVSPAAIDTPILDDFVHAFGERARRGIALTERPGSAAEVAAAICFLLRAESEWIRGVDLPVDGGLDAVLEMSAMGVVAP